MKTRKYSNLENLKSHHEILIFVQILQNNSLFMLTDSAILLGTISNYSSITAHTNPSIKDIESVTVKIIANLSSFFSFCTLTIKLHIEQSVNSTCVAILSMMNWFKLPSTNKVNYFTKKNKLKCNEKKTVAPKGWMWMFVWIWK